MVLNNCLWLIFLECFKVSKAFGFSWRTVIGGMSGFKSLGRWTPCRNLLNIRGYAHERSTSNVGCDDGKHEAPVEKTNSTSQDVQKKTTREETVVDSCDDSGEIPTPSLMKAKTTKDFFISSREQRLREKAKDVDVLKLQETFRKGASTADLDSG